jgi:hypothetical protein
LQESVTHSGLLVAVQTTQEYSSDKHKISKDVYAILLAAKTSFVCFINTQSISLLSFLLLTYTFTFSLLRQEVDTFRFRVLLRHKEAALSKLLEVESF